MRQTGQLIRRPGNTIEIRVDQRPTPRDHHDVLHPEIGQRMAALGQLP